MEKTLKYTFLFLVAVTTVARLQAQPGGHHRGGGGPSSHQGNPHHSNPGNHYGAPYGGGPHHAQGHCQPHPVAANGYYGRPGPHYPHHYGYYHLPRYRSTVAYLPSGAVIMGCGGVNYWYHSGIYYRPITGGYCVVNAPRGMRLRVLPPNFINVTIGPSAYYYYYGSFYQQDRATQEYYSVAPPIGATVNALPEGYDKVTIEGITYYVFDGTYYKAFLTQNQEVWYEVVGQR